MAGNLAGMFNQINSAVQANPLGGEMGQGLLNTASQGAGNMMGGVLGQEGTDFMSQGGKELQAQKMLSELDLGTADGMAKAAEVYGMVGDTAKQMAMTQAAQAKAVSDVELRRVQLKREQLAQAYRKRGMPDAAERALSGGDVEKMGEELRELERDDILAKQNWPTNKKLLENAGVTASDIESLKDASADTIKEYLNGQKGKIQPFLDAGNNIVSIRENDFGRVWDEQAQKWVDPSAMGLSPAPSLSRIQNVSTQLADDLAGQSGTVFMEEYAAANEAQGVIDGIDRSLPKIDAMPTGLGAPIKHFYNQVASAIGMEGPAAEAANYDEFVAEAGTRVMSNIKAFGSGSAISDADREYAKLISAANPAAQAQALKNLLNIQRKAAQGQINRFKASKHRMRGRLEKEGRGYEVDAFVVQAPSGTPGVLSGASESAKSYFEE